MMAKKTNKRFVLLGLGMLIAPLLSGCGPWYEGLFTKLGLKLYVRQIGDERRALLIMPRGYKRDRPIPLVVNLHAYTSDPGEQDDYFGLSARVQEDDFALMMVAGTTDSDGDRFWNATDFCCDKDNSGVDDVAYLRELIVDAERIMLVSRVFVVGTSNGGFMAYRMACEGVPKLAGIASVGGATFADAARCEGADPISVLHVHGTDDGVVRYAGADDEDGRYAGAEESVRRWAGRAGCGEPEALPNIDLDTDVKGEETARLRYQTGCEAGVTAELWRVEGGGHIPDFEPADFGRRLNSWLFEVVGRTVPGAAEAARTSPAVETETAEPADAGIEQPEVAPAGATTTAGEKTSASGHAPIKDEG